MPESNFVERTNIRCVLLPISIDVKNTFTFEGGGAMQGIAGDMHL